MLEITKVPRSQDLRTRAAVLRQILTGEKVFDVGDIVQFSNRLYRVTFWGLDLHVVLRDVETNEPRRMFKNRLGNVRLVKKGSRRG